MMEHRDGLVAIKRFVDNVVAPADMVPCLVYCGGDDMFTATPSGIPTFKMCEQVKQCVGVAKAFGMNPEAVAVEMEHSTRNGQSAPALYVRFKGATYWSWVNRTFSRAPEVSDPDDWTKMMKPMNHWIEDLL